MAALAFGCGRCFGEDAEAAWDALNAERLHALVQESHFGVRASACACGQVYVIVFTERIDWSGGEDDQTWLALPVHARELDELDGLDESALPSKITALGRERRFLVRAFPTGGRLGAWWRDGGLAIGPHD